MSRVLFRIARRRHSSCIKCSAANKQSPSTEISWIDEQKKLATVPLESPVYLSLRMDGRVRGSGVGYPPWSALVAQLPPVKGLWSGILDGMDGRVL
ncbi:protein LOW PSII ACCUMULATION 1, chloroplastic-like [Phalaenopsis equestris]|uniref:protein LOW PSII ACCUMULATION 1, chloroplastic-like n=1 Tax=Phalaenopsis equestris TaxID=78828 RepID=UPI0009E262F4|nr:protein LOW PSII ACCUMULATION 1, chloroplastic-like [Phalaenopsis equestris]